MPSLPLRILLRTTLAALIALSPLPRTNAAHAGDIDLARLMQLFAEAPDNTVTYTEQKFSSLLAEPVASSGTLAFRRPDTVEKAMAAPRKERFRIAGEELIVQREGTEKRFALASQPLLAAMAASLRGVLAGDAPLLRRHFRMTLEGEAQAWRLELVPLDEEVARHLERILVSGQDGRIGLIETRETSGDRSVLRVR